MLLGLLLTLPQDIRTRCRVLVKAGSRLEFLDELEVASESASGRGALKAIRSSSVVVLGGGTHIHDDYSTRRYMRHVRYMVMLIMLSLITRLMGKKVLWLGMGLGPCYRRMTSRLLKLALRVPHVVTVRDRASMKEASRAGRDVPLTFDLAALLFEGLEQRVGGQRRSIGISVMSLEAIPSAASWRSSLIDHLRLGLEMVLDAEPDVEVKIFTIRGGTREDDAAVSALLHRSLTEKYRDRVYLLPYQPDPRTTVLAIQECTVFVGMRFHACLLAALSRCAVLFVPYHRKVQDLAHDLECPSVSVLNPNRAEAGTIASRLRSALSDGDEFRPGVPTATLVADAKRNIDHLMEAVS